MDVAEATLVEINKRINGLSEWLSSGRCESFEEYQSTVGQIRGLRQAVSTLKSLAKNEEIDDDDI